MITWFAGLMWL